jgi:hypothetical protein
MNAAETKELLRQIAVIDKRQVTPETISAWQSILAHIPLDVALEAHKLARRDSNVAYLEPRHIVVWAKEAAFKLDRKKPKEEEVLRGDPEPTCRRHNKRILSCDVCTRMIYEQEHLHDAALLLWAKEHVYV